MYEMFINSHRKSASSRSQPITLRFILFHLHGILDTYPAVLLQHILLSFFTLETGRGNMQTIMLCSLLFVSLVFVNTSQAAPVALAADDADNRGMAEKPLIRSNYMFHDSIPQG